MEDAVISATTPTVDSNVHVPKVSNLMPTTKHVKVSTLDILPFITFYHVCYCSGVGA